MGKSETQFRSGLLGAVERRDADQEYFKKMSVLGHPSVSGYNSGIYVGNVNLYQPMESDMNRQSQYQNPNQVGYRQSQFQMDNRQSQYQMENRQSQYQNQGDYRQSQHNQMDNRKSQYNNANGMPKDENRQSTIAPRIK